MRLLFPRKRDELVRMAADIFVHSGKKAGDELSREEFDELLQSEDGECLGGSEVFPLLVCRVFPWQLPPVGDDSIPGRYRPLGDVGGNVHGLTKRKLRHRAR